MASASPGSIPRQSRPDDGPLAAQHPLHRLADLGDAERNGRWTEYANQKILALQNTCRFTRDKCRPAGAVDGQQAPSLDLCPDARNLGLAFSATDYVFLGDSITAGGRMFGRLDTVNLGSSGLTTHQIASGLQGVNKYKPRHVVVMAGTNDSFEEFDEVRMRKDWDTIAADPRTIIVLAPPTRNADANARLARINAIAARAAERNHKKPLALTELRGPDGLLRATYSEDGVHLTDDAYEFWKRRLP